MFKKILLVTISIICENKVTEAIDTGKGANFDLKYIKDKNLLQFDATLLPNTWLGLGFGSGMV